MRGSSTGSGAGTGTGGASPNAMVHPDPRSAVGTSSGALVHAMAALDLAESETPSLAERSHGLEEEGEAVELDLEDEAEDAFTASIKTDEARSAEERRRSHRFLRMVMMDAAARDDMEENLLSIVSKQTGHALGMYASIVDYEECEDSDKARELAARVVTRYARPRAPMYVEGLSDDARDPLVAWTETPHAAALPTMFDAAREELLSLLEADTQCVAWLATAVTKLRKDPARLLLNAARRTEVIRVAGLYKLNVDAVKLYDAVCQSDVETDPKRAMLMLVEGIAAFVSPASSLTYLSPATREGLLKQCQDTRRVSKETKKIFAVAKAEVCAFLASHSVLLSLCDDEHRDHLESILEGAGRKTQAESRRTLVEGRRKTLLSPSVAGT